MKKSIFIISFAWAGLAFAGGEEGGGPKSRAEQPIQIEIPLDAGKDVPTFIVDPLTGRMTLNPKLPEIKVSADDMRRAVEAAISNRTIPVDLGKGEIVTFRPENLDFLKRQLQGRLLEDGTRLKLQQVRDIEIQH